MKRSLRSWLWRVPIDEEVDEEIAFHIEMRTRELVERGMDPESARASAMRRLGDAQRLRRTCVDISRKRDREMRLTTWLHELRDDVRFAMRQMRRAPAFTAIAAVTLALGIGANSAIFALVDATLLRPLPFPEPERLVTIWERTDTSARSAASPLNVLDWNERNRTFDQISGYVPNVGGMVMSGANGTSVTVPRQWVLAGFFDVLAVTPIAGRTFLPSDNSERASVIVLNEGFWRTQFGADPAIVGRSIRLDGLPFTVVGVVPQRSELLRSTDIWALLAVEPLPVLRNFYGLRGIGRLKKGATLEAARADLAAVAEGLSRELPETNKGRSVTLESMQDTLVGRELRLTSILFLAVVGLVLVICCANVASLVIARATVRTRELAIRSALGAGRLRVIRQLLTESLVLSLVGGALAIGVGAAILAAAPSIIPPALLPATVTLAFDWHIVAFCATSAVAVGLTFGLVPALKATRAASAQVLASDTRTATGGGGRIRGVLVVVEVATAVVLLFGASLLLRSLIALSNVDRGYRAEHVLSLLMDPLGSSYPTPESLQQFYDAVEREIRAVPGVQHVAWASTLPLGPSYFGAVSVEIAGRAQTDPGARVAADYQIVSPSYFETLGVPVVAGRGFTDLDRRDTPPVCIVNEAFARRHLAGMSQIGARVAVRQATTRGQGPPVMREVVGIARQVKGRPDESEDLVQIYVPMSQDLFDDTFLVVRPASAQIQGLAASVRRAIAQVDKEQLVSVSNVRTLEDVAWEATSRHRFRAVLVMTFASLALVLAMVGVFGILAYSVQKRMRDFGVRRALGATATDVLGLVVRSAARVVLAGVLIGLIVSTMLGRLLDAVLFGVRPSDPVTFAVVTLLLCLTAGLATAWPAWRAIRIDPVVALRTE